MRSARSARSARRLALAGGSLLLAAALLAALAGPARAHCEIPCGIYGDETRFTIMREHIATIEKSMRSIQKLGEARDKDWNQLVRWVDNKELHAAKLQEVVWQYFLTQRVKLPEDQAGRQAYLRQLELLHRLSVYAMKCKQTVDLEWVEKLGAAVDEFEKAYLGR
jgi:nickel superoxide dismutase